MAKALFALILLAGFSVGMANEKFDHPFFKSVEGEWTGGGSLADANGESTEIAEKWTAGESDDGGFVFSGTRQLPEQTQEFRWHFSYNAATESIESTYWHTGMDDPIEFQISLTDDSVSMVSFGSDSGGEISVVNTISDEGLVGVVSVKNGDGQEVMGGTVNHTRVKHSVSE